MRQERFDTPGQVEVVVDNKLGDVRICTHDEATTEVQLEAQGSRADEVVSRARVEHRSPGGGDKVIVEVPYPPGLLLRGGFEVVVTVRLPEGGVVDVETISGTVTGEGRLGRAAVRTTSGDVSLGPIDGAVVARSTSGDVTVGPIGGLAEISTSTGSVRCAALSQAGQVKTVSGDVDIISAGGRLRAETMSGEITAGDLADGCDLKTVSGDQSVRRLLAGEAEFRTVSGDMTIGVARGTAVMVDAQSLSGSLTSEIDLYQDEPVGSEPDQQEGRRADLRAHSVSGDVRIQRAPA
jgi:Putative adhesin